MDHVNYDTVEFQSGSVTRWLDRQWWYDQGRLEKDATLQTAGGEEFVLTETNIYDIIAELHKVAQWLQGEE